MADENPPPTTQPDVQTQIDGLSSRMKEMTETITTLVKAITPGNAVAQSDVNSVESDPQTVHSAPPDPLRVIPEQEMGTDSLISTASGGTDHTYPIQEPTAAFLDVAFRLKKPAENKTRREWVERFQVPECDATRCPKLDSIIEDVVKKDAVDEDSQLSRLQNFYLDSVGPLVAAFEELSKDAPDADLVSGAVQQALLFLGSANAHVSQVRRTKILNRLNRDVKGLAKDIDFSKSAPYLFGEGIEQKIKDRAEAVRVLRRTTSSEFKPKQFFPGSSSQGSGSGRGRFQPQFRYHPYQHPKSFGGPKRTFQKPAPRGRGQ